MKPRRLDAALAHHLAITRNTARDAVRAGRVRVAGAVQRNAAFKVADEPLTLDGRAVEPLPDAIHLMLHKPLDTVCSHDADDGPPVFDLLPERWRPLRPEPVGRLDRDTTGLLLFTSDGKLLHRLISPKAKVPKRYRITYTGALRKNAVELCALGFPLPGDRNTKPTLPAELVIEDEAHATLTLNEGRYHQVKRMMLHCGGKVTALHRDRIGALDLPADLAPGACRLLTDEELALAQMDGHSGQTD